MPLQINTELLLHNLRKDRNRVSSHHNIFGASALAEIHPALNKSSRFASVHNVLQEPSMLSNQSNDLSTVFTQDSSIRISPNAAQAMGPNSTRDGYTHRISLEGFEAPRDVNSSSPYLDPRYSPEDYTSTWNALGGTQDEWNTPAIGERMDSFISRSSDNGSLSKASQSVESSPNTQNSTNDHQPGLNTVRAGIPNSLASPIQMSADEAKLRRSQSAYRVGQVDRYGNSLDQSLPQSDTERATDAMRIRDAMMSITQIIDGRKTGVNCWINHMYDDLDVEAWAWLVQETCEQIHTAGYCYPRYDCRLLEVKPNKVLSYSQRVTAVCDVLCRRKAYCTFVIQGDLQKIWGLIANPAEVDGRARVNLKSNGQKNEDQKAGRELRRGSQAESAPVTTPAIQRPRRATIQTKRKWDDSDSRVEDDISLEESDGEDRPDLHRKRLKRGN
ncbi:uncharacterized protein BDZ99DRAFT_528110 [Mytilinidion resinicola]|uniref:Uncharacterized protein n=1 Tax=Mytilinidion resinicola TaxID=574789 RepID=A0A6A6Y1E5_9PEZI|nr:uncharacterized protein BDZ99DRAFT_528110 [Mytilinidion resinicola]KAF2801637.1 hypothetical protein BDZ99DRAFT_528110 [Mytilinidion resinicola]